MGASIAALPRMWLQRLLRPPAVRAGTPAAAGGAGVAPFGPVPASLRVVTIQYTKFTLYIGPVPIFYKIGTRVQHAGAYLAGIVYSEGGCDHASMAYFACLLPKFYPVPGSMSRSMSRSTRSINESVSISDVSV